MTAHTPIHATQPSDFTRAQLLILSHISALRDALALLRSAPAMIPSIREAHKTRLMRWLGACKHVHASILAAPGGAFAYIGLWGHNGHGPTIERLCGDVASSVKRAREGRSYRDVVAARWGMVG